MIATHEASYHLREWRREKEVEGQWGREGGREGVSSLGL